MTSISANDRKTKGVAAIEAALADQPEAAVSVRGKERFVVMELSQYHYLRECQLEAALAETRSDYSPIPALGTRWWMRQIRTTTEPLKRYNTPYVNDLRGGRRGVNERQPLN